MLLAAVRELLKPTRCPIRTLPRYSSSSHAPPKSATWRELNRIPTPACIDSSPESRPTSTTTSEPAPDLAPAPQPFFPPEIEALYRGNQRFRDAIAASATPNVLRDLAAQGQRPPFLLLDCSDSRVGEQVIFSAEPGTLFTTGNVANQFHEHDLNSKAVLAYAVEALKVKHVIVMGHYGCGGVAAATLPPPPDPTSTTASSNGHDAHQHGNPGACKCHEHAHADPVQAWIAPIRHIYESSVRPEIVAHRQLRRVQAAAGEEAQAPHLNDPAFRALVEENVKANVLRIVNSRVIRNHYAALPPAQAQSPTQPGVFIHGWVYDIESGEVADLGVTVGPPGALVPPSPFPLLQV
ncbi:hypothetical protein H0H81_012166 [Sphagnurus paluster]|uniref:Carbonic anhydrase n=1 Tax=Sphagnurus paluster TaxID=117069 RepID=A0A9P7GIR3_9AGAR|nr:hypothetical protein H0H81_012166 [Sphagnurus paluster]